MRFVLFLFVILSLEVQTVKKSILTSLLSCLLLLCVLFAGCGTPAVPADQPTAQQANYP